MYPSHWRALTCNLSWLKRVHPKSPLMICCPSFATMAPQEVWDNQPFFSFFLSILENKPKYTFFYPFLFSAPAGGHYIAYCQNVINGQWYEFDDQYVTEVHETVVQNAEAYVLFYRWASEDPVTLNLHISLTALPLSEFPVLFCFGHLQEKQRGVCKREAEGGGSGQHEGTQPAAVLHLQRMAEQIQHLCRTGPHQQPHLPLSARRCVSEIFQGGCIPVLPRSKTYVDFLKGELA